MGEKKKEKKKQKRCVKRNSLPLNKGKWRKIVDMVDRFCKEKDYFLAQYFGKKKIGIGSEFWSLRNQLVEMKYKSKFGLQARNWKLALKEAVETLDRYWARLAVDWEKRIRYSAHLSSEEKQYLSKIVNKAQVVNSFLHHGFKPETNIALSKKQIQKCRCYLRKVLHETVKKPPRVHIKRSLVAEPETYRVFEEKNRQYIKLTTNVPGQRLIIPLAGKGQIHGQIRVVLCWEKRRIEIHCMQESSVENHRAKGKAKAIDLGITEVFTDSDGDRFGTDFGKTLAQYSDELLKKGKRRNPLHALHRHYQQHNPEKAKQIRKYNLGKKKLAQQHRKQKIRITEIVNRSLNRFLQSKDPKIVVYEDLHHLNGKAKSKKLSRLVSLWVRQTIQDRLSFKVSQRGSLLRQVNCAYSSQVCPRCGWVSPSNRSGDSFSCSFCGLTALSDFCAALELLRRKNDPEISLWTPKAQVKLILLARFRRRLECGKSSLDYSRCHWDKLRQAFEPDLLDDLLQKLGVPSVILPVQDVPISSAQEKPIASDSPGTLSATVPGKTPNILPRDSLSSNALESETRFHPMDKRFQQSTLDF